MLYRHKRLGHTVRLLAVNALNHANPVGPGQAVYEHQDDGSIWHQSWVMFLTKHEPISAESTPFSFNPLADIQQFHIKFGLEYRDLPRILPPDIADFRRRFMQEELDEWHSEQDQAEKSAELRDLDQAGYTHHLEGQLDAMVDLMYVLLGTVHLQGLSSVFAEAWRRVHEANMAKVRVERVEDSSRGSAYDVIKPEGWEPPTHTDLVESHLYTKLTPQ